MHPQSLIRWSRISSSTLFKSSIYWLCTAHGPTFPWLEMNMDQRHTQNTNTEYRRWEAMVWGSGLSLWWGHVRVQQEHLQPTPQRSNICFSALENQSIRNKMGFTPEHCHTEFSMMWPRKWQCLKQSVIHGTGKVSRHPDDPRPSSHNRVCRRRALRNIAIARFSFFWKQEISMETLVSF